MGIEDEVRSLIEHHRRERQDAGIAGGTEGSIVALTDWVYGLEEALILVAREVEGLRSSRKP